MSRGSDALPKSKYPGIEKMHFIYRRFWAKKETKNSDIPLPIKK